MKEHRQELHDELPSREKESPLLSSSLRSSPQGGMLAQGHQNIQTPRYLPGREHVYKRHPARARYLAFTEMSFLNRAAGVLCAMASSIGVRTKWE